jgi:hypothetical protein
VTVVFFSDESLKKFHLNGWNKEKQKKNTIKKCFM